MLTYKHNLCALSLLLSPFASLEHSCGLHLILGKQHSWSALECNKDHISLLMKCCHKLISCDKYFDYADRLQVLTFSSHKHSHHSFQKRLWSPSLRFHIKARKRIHDEGGVQRKVFSHPKHRNIPLGSAVHVCLNMKNVNALPCITLQCVLRYLFT